MSAAHGVQAEIDFDQERSMLGHEYLVGCFLSSKRGQIHAVGRYLLLFQYDY